MLFLCFLFQGREGKLAAEHGGAATGFLRPMGYTPRQGGMRVYLDLALLLNFCVDHLLLMGANRLSGFPVEWSRTAAAASVGAIYGAATLLPGLGFLGEIHWKLISLGAVCAIAFGCSGNFWKRGCIFLLLTMALGGMAAAMGTGKVWLLILSAGIMFGLCTGAVGGRIGGRRYLPIEIEYRGRTMALTAMVDTGNTLQDPLTGETVTVLGADAAMGLTGLSREALQNPVKTIEERQEMRLRLLPYRTVGTERGMLLLLRADSVRTGRRALPGLLALSPNTLGNEGYQALTGGAI